MDAVGLNELLFDLLKIAGGAIITGLGAYIAIMKFVYTRFGEFTKELAVTNKTLSNIEQAITKYEQDYSNRHDKLEQKVEAIEGRMDRVEKDIIELRK